MSTRTQHDQQMSLDLFAVVDTTLTEPATPAPSPEPSSYQTLIVAAPTPHHEWLVPASLDPEHWAAQLAAPASAADRFRANLAALDVAIDQLDGGRQLDDINLAVLRRWSAWGGLASFFENDAAGAAQLETRVRRLASLLGRDDDAAWDTTQASTLTAHYTHPEIAGAMWQIAYKHGFRGGPVLEPGCGSGMFLSLAPDSACATGVEIDPCAAQIADLLNPAATILADSFTASKLREGRFALAIGNVPFGRVAPYDPVHNKAKHSLHNYFILKSLRLLEPGAIAVLLTTHFTLDSLSSTVRQEIAALGELVDVVRLPSAAHRTMAGTDVLSDILVLRRHASDAAAAEYLAANPEWLTAARIDFPGGPADVNRYMLDDAGQRFVLGHYSVRVGMYGGLQLEVDGPTEPRVIADEIRHVLSLPARPQPHAAPAAVAPAVVVEVAPAPDGLLVPAESPLDDLDAYWDGHLLIHDRQLWEVVDSQAEPITVPATTLRELRPLLEMRDMARELLDLESQTTGEHADLEDLRTRLHRAWERYVTNPKYGPVNRYTERRTGRVDPATGQDRLARVMPKAIKVLLGDPSGALVLSLEQFDEESRTATPAPILTRRVLEKREPITHADTPADALAVSLDQTGLVDLPLIASLLGTTEQAAREQLGDTVYLDPESDRLVPASEYLSGNVRTKLDRAYDAAITDPSLNVNIAALEQVLPRPLDATEVTPQIGAVWIPDTVHADFLRDILDSKWVTVEHGIDNLWFVEGPSHGTLATSTWGTGRVPAPKIFQHLLEQKPLKVHDTINVAGEETKVLNVEETAAAIDKSVAIVERFAEWVWEDPERTETLLDLYNRLFNSLVLRDYTDDGKRLTLPGLSGALVPTEHQRTAIARIISEPAVGLFHVVGAGKTLDLAAGAMELRRLGLIRKPALLVPNHMLEQMTREMLQLYPHARVLAASTEDLKKEKRRAFLAKIASNDWDAVILTSSALERLPMSREFQEGYMREEIHRLRQSLADNETRKKNDPTGNFKNRTHNDIQKMIKNAEQRLQALLDKPVDPAVSFENTGIDYLLVDEQHRYKNLTTDSNIPDARIAPGSKRATDLHMKVEYLRSREGLRVATFATATPIANSITEAYVTQRYLRPDLLLDAGIHHFDQWAATFGERVTAVEMAPAGGGSYRVATRFARFKNVPEMLRMWHVFADVKTAEDLDLPRPKLVKRPDGERAPRTVIIPTPVEMEPYLTELVSRAEAISNGGVKPEEDNMLKVTGDGRRAALDMRLIDGTVLAGKCKLEHAADEIAAIDARHRHREYLLPGTDQKSSLTGGLQIVFCDVSTPNVDRWNAYDELRLLLADRGIPADRVRFIHDAKNDTDKARLFEACRVGKVSVIVGSTEKMGTGTNIQTRVTALHHLDCPWRPADVEQREGRALRQGNQNEQIEIIRYCIERTFDAYNWQTVERKARFIAQVTRGRLDVREIDDISDSVLSFAEIKAAASGDPLILDHATALADLKRFQMRKRAFDRNLNQLHYQQQSHKAAITAIEGEIARLGDLLRLRDSQPDSDPVFEFRGQQTTDRYEAARALRSWAESTQVGGGLRPVAKLCGVPLYGRVTLHPLSASLVMGLQVDQLYSTEVAATLPQLKQDPLILIRSLLDSIAALDQREPWLESKIQTARAEIELSHQAAEATFPEEDALHAANREVERLEAAMKAAQEERDRKEREAAIAAGATVAA